MYIASFWLACYGAVNKVGRCNIVSIQRGGVATVVVTATTDTWIRGGQFVDIGVFVTTNHKLGDCGLF